MNGRGRLSEVIHKALEHNDLPFRDFVELALYHPDLGYYAQRAQPETDYITSPRLSPLFGATLGGLIREFSNRAGSETSTVVDIGCGDGSLIHSLYLERERTTGLRYYGVDRSLARLRPEVRDQPGLHFVRGLDEVPRSGSHLILANELFDALPFARLVQRDEHLHELWVTDREGNLDWTEHEAPGPYEDYFSARGIELEEGQFVLALEAEFHRIHRQHAVDREMPADIAQELDVVERRQPFGVVDHHGPLGAVAEVDEFGEGLPEALLVGLDLLVGEELAGFVLARR